jgi:hypothetical protein
MTQNRVLLMDTDNAVKVLVPVREFVQKYYPFKSRDINIAPLCQYYVSLLGDCSASEHRELARAEFLNTIEVAELALDNYSSLGPELATKLLIHNGFLWNSPRLENLFQRASALLKGSQEIHILDNCTSANYVLGLNKASRYSPLRGEDAQALLDRLQNVCIYF